MEASEILGIIAGILTTSSFFPQVLKVIKTNDTKSISLVMYLLFCIGVCLCLIFGVLIGSLSVILANTITLPMALIILYKKIKNG